MKERWPVLPLLKTYLLFSALWSFLKSLCLTGLSILLLLATLSYRSGKHRAASDAQDPPHIRIPTTDSPYQDGFLPQISRTVSCDLPESPVYISLWILIFCLHLITWFPGTDSWPKFTANCTQDNIIALMLLSCFRFTTCCQWGFYPPYYLMFDHCHFIYLRAQPGYCAHGHVSFTTVAQSPGLALHPLGLHCPGFYIAVVSCHCLCHFFLFALFPCFIFLSMTTTFQLHIACNLPP